MASSNRSSIRFSSIVVEPTYNPPPATETLSVIILHNPKRGTYIKLRDMIMHVSPHIGRIILIDGISFSEVSVVGGMR